MPYFNGFLLVFRPKLFISDPPHLVDLQWD